MTWERALYKDNLVTLYELIKGVERNSLQFSTVFGLMHTY